MPQRPMRGFLMNLDCTASKVQHNRTIEGAQRRQPLFHGYAYPISARSFVRARRVSRET
jgi:hypothetical protein